MNILEDKSAISYAEIKTLTKAVTWGDTYYPSLEKWQQILAKSSHVAYVKDQGKVVAFGRIVEDGMMCMFYDICVHPEYQRQKIGTQIMNHLIAKLKDNKYVSIGLFVWSGNSTASNFYRQFGFEQAAAMELKQL